MIKISTGYLVKALTLLDLQSYEGEPLLDLFEVSVVIFMGDVPEIWVNRLNQPSVKDLKSVIHEFYTPPLHEIRLHLHLGLGN